VPLQDVYAGLAPDLALRPGDILEIPHTFDTIAQEWFVKNMLLGPFQVGVRYDPLAQYNANRALNEANQFNQQSLNQAILQSIGSGLPQLFVPPVTPP
jgi:hypothetical protein